MSIKTTTNKGFSNEQTHYLEGFFAGIRSHGLTFQNIEAEAAPGDTAELAGEEDLTKEERIKREQHPLDALESLATLGKAKQAPEAPDAFRFKWSGLFWLTPVENAYMCRLRIPGGSVKAAQLREVAAIARELTTGYIQITTRNNLQVRLIPPEHCLEVLRRVQGCGLHSRGAGGDNIRNITTNPTAGFDPHELIDTMPMVDELATILVSSREFYDLPRKFNIAFDGGGLVSSVEDTNDIGCQAVRIPENAEGIQPGIWFRVLLGGVTGHETFARDAGVLVSSEQLNAVILAMLRVFIKEGDRSSRKKARLKYLLEKIGVPEFLRMTEKLLPFALVRVPSGLHEAPRAFSQQEHGHVGVYPQRDAAKSYIGASVPVGQLSAEQLDGIARIAELYGTGEVRLTVWQNFIVPHIPTHLVQQACQELNDLGFPTTQSHLRSGFVACTGSRFCKYAAADTKGNAVAMMAYLDARVHLDQPINIHFTGCAHSCAQHFMGDIGLLAAKVKHDGEMVEGYHITLGGGFGENRKVGRQVFTGVPFPLLGPCLEGILRAYLANRAAGERFHQFCNRHSVAELQSLFAYGR